MIEALILGLIQGLTEFLPVSSSGHLEIGKALFGIQAENSLFFTVTVHFGTVLSTLVVFRKDIANLLSQSIKKENAIERHYIGKLLVSAIPAAFVGLLFKDQIEQLFAGDNLLTIVGICLIVTALLLLFAWLKKAGEKQVGYRSALAVGLAQMVAILPGLSRSGATISTALMLNIKREEASRFSFLMVLLPIAGEMLLDVLKLDLSSTEGFTPAMLVGGFAAAFLSGLFACKMMIKIVNRGKLIYFAIYCVLAGLVTLILL